MIVTGKYVNVGNSEYVNSDGCKIRFRYSFDNKSELFDVKEFKIEGATFTLEHNISPNKKDNAYFFAILDKNHSINGSISFDVEKDEFYLTIPSHSIKISKDRVSENNDEWKFGK